MWNLEDSAKSAKKMVVFCGLGGLRGSVLVCHPVLRRFWMFNAVGAIGIVVQVAALLGLRNLAGLGYLPATALAVEIAVIHNFLWHERWTWVDVTRRDRRGLMRRLARFHVSNGLISAGGNLLLMSTLVGGLGWDFVWANLAAIAACWLLNFLAGDRFVFSGRV